MNSSPPKKPSFLGVPEAILQVSSSRRSTAPTLRILPLLSAIQRLIPSLTMSLIGEPASLKMPPFVEVGAHVLPIAVRTAPRLNVRSMPLSKKVTIWFRGTRSFGLKVVGPVPCVTLLKKAWRINGQKGSVAATSVNGPQLAVCAWISAGFQIRMATRDSHHTRRMVMKHLRFRWGHGGINMLLLLQSNAQC